MYKLYNHQIGIKINIEQNIEDINLLDEELFMSKEEKGVYNQCLNIELEKKHLFQIKKPIVCYVNLIGNKFKNEFHKKRNKFKLTHKSPCQLCGTICIHTK